MFFNQRNVGLRRETSIVTPIIDLLHSQTPDAVPTNFIYFDYLESHEFISLTRRNRAHVKYGV